MAVSTRASRYVWKSSDVEFEDDLEFDPDELQQFHLKGQHYQKTHGGGAAHIPDVTDTVRVKGTTNEAVITAYMDHKGEPWLRGDFTGAKKWQKADDLEVVKKGTGIGNETKVEEVKAPEPKVEVPVPTSTKPKVSVGGKEYEVTESGTFKGEEWVKLDTDTKKKWYKKSELDAGESETQTKAQSDDTSSTGVTTPTSKVSKVVPVEDHKPYRSPEVDTHQAKISEIVKRQDALSAEYKTLQDARSKEMGDAKYGTDHYKKVAAKYDLLEAERERRASLALKEYGDAIDARNAQIAKETGKPIVTREMISSKLIKQEYDQDYDISTEQRKAIRKKMIETGEGTWKQVESKDYKGRKQWSMEFDDGLGLDSEQRFKRTGTPPDDWDPRKGTHPTAEKYLNSRGELYDMYRARELGMSLDDYRAEKTRVAKGMVSNALETGGTFIRVAPSTLAKLDASGRFMTQHELQPNKESTGHRAVMESVLFGSKGGEGHPIYGYLSSSPTGRVTQASIGGKNKKTDSDDWLDGYGEVALKMKKTTHENATVIHGDTMDIAGKGMYQSARPLLNPDGSILHHGVIGHSHSTMTANARSHNPVTAYRDVDDKHSTGFTSSWGANGYFEVQWHKSLGLGDVEEAVFPKKPTPQQRKILEKYGIKITVIPGAE